MILEIQKLSSILKIASVKYDPDVLYFLLGKVVDLEKTLSTESLLLSALEDFKAWVHATPNSGITELTTGVTMVDGKATADIYTVRYADRKNTIINSDLLTAPEFIELQKLWTSIQSVSKLPVTLKVGEEVVSFENYNDFYNHVMESTKKGIYIQRYKGLGEMNPEQLWETTLNRENRSLLQVSIDDAVAADETFSILMGELVEPRRQFIQENALLAGSLDV